MTHLLRIGSNGVAVCSEVGNRYGAWTVLAEAPSKEHCGKKFRQVVARCDCGTERVIHLSNLRQHKTTRCRKCARVTHGMRSSPEYYIWISMRARCSNPNNASYADYGGRGVKVCARWDPSQGGSFENFIADVGRRPTANHQLDKEALCPGSLEYGPTTTRWVEILDNANRKRNNRLIEYRGEVRTLAQWERFLGVKKSLLQLRLRNGWTIEEAITTPVGTRRKR